MKFLAILSAALASASLAAATPLEARQASNSSSSSSLTSSMSASTSASSTSSASSSSSASASTSTGSSANSTSSSSNSTIINSNNSTLSYNSTATANSSSVYGVGAAGFAQVNKAKHPLNIVLTNDDSWASANIRAFYYALRRAGHRVLMVAPSHNQSGKGGTVVLPATLNLTDAGRGGFAPVGAPYAGLNVSDPGIRYFNGTPAACSGWALDNDAALFFNATNSTSSNSSVSGVDLIVSGPNEGQNLGPFIYTLSGTVGAAYFAVERNVPAIAFSANTNPRDYPTLNLSNPNDESIKIATYSANLVTAMSDQVKSSNSSARILPLGIGASVNYPGVQPTGNCTNLTWVQSRLTGKAYIDKFVVNATTKLPTYQNLVTDGVNVCLAGNCSLPGETDVVSNEKCQAAVSLFSVDYDAPTNATASALSALVSSINMLNSNSTQSQNSTMNSTSSA